LGRAELAGSREAQAAFEARFSDLVELICDAAHAGHATASKEARYAALQAWMQEHFSHIEGAFAPAIHAELTGLFSPPSLTTLLEQDDGRLMLSLQQTQEAVLAWKNIPAS
jgi:hypothetical protein